MLPFKSKLLLFPYWVILKIRHSLYDRKIKKSISYNIPVICVGNITVGGTGKTPHTEMLIRLLRDKYKVAVLSRGYKRKTKGFRIAQLTDTFEQVGDEPLQIKQKFPDILIAVCASRREGIEKLLALPEHEQDACASNSSGNAQSATAAIYRPTLIILDDAFQHRKVTPSHSVVLMNYSNPIYNDNLLPLGTLRDLPEQIKRADSVIISKSPLFGEMRGVDGIIDQQEALKQVEEKETEWRRNLSLKEHQQLYFSTITYGEPLPVFPYEADSRYIYSKNAVYFTGIANDKEFRDNIVGSHKIQDAIKFADHRSFSESDIARIHHLAAKYPTAVVFTTEKDSKRLITNRYLNADLRKRLFYIPIEVEISPTVKKEEFIASLK
ncbi:MAG: tetraacyldisaccharide 4'-kinase [Bacteroidales bacterium]